MITATALSRAEMRPPADVEELRTYLQAALEVEHLTIPVYMTGMYSIVPGTNQPAYFTIRSVVLEEMLHMTLAANLLNAVGGEPSVDFPEFVAGYPAHLPFSDPSLPLIPLRHFSRTALETFMLIERPRSFVPDPGEETTGWTSIGQFYDAIRQGLITLEGRQREEHAADPTRPATIFTGPPARQIGPEDFYNSGGEAFPVTDLKSALLAVETISDQGEGVEDTIWTSDDTLFGEERQVAHYFRFKEIRAGRRYGGHDLPRTEPSGPLLDVTWDDAYPIDPEATVDDYPEGTAVRQHADAFNHRYADLLTLLQYAVAGRPGRMREAVPVMLELRDLAQRLYRNPHPDPDKAAQGLHASPTFELLTEHFTQARARVAPSAPESALDGGVDRTG
ncbi:ferritin-like protein [Streptomyces sp. NPDC046727]|uniref:ferritin-like domain-containing protein n=1 Tax=Streptomyces sp. NPDC046727 TaxID=3155373 RepID=UPI003405192A